MLLSKIEDFTLMDLHGKEVSITEYRGKKTLIFMWASW
ncbi:peroxiredoxin family protein [Bacillus sp. AK128]